jgi:hypothetical protein
LIGEMDSKKARLRTWILKQFFNNRDGYCRVYCVRQFYFCEIPRIRD